MGTTERLSILICSLRSRAEMLEKLTRFLEAQRQKLSTPSDVAIIIEVDDGEMSIGEKRNRLIDTARGEYVCFIDDDDTVSDQYMELVLEALKTNPDCVGLTGIIKHNGIQQLFVHSRAFAGWYEGADGVFYRTPNHLNPVKRKIAQRAQFTPVNFAEDMLYSKAILPYLDTEEKIDEPIYFYDCSGRDGQK